MAKRHLALALAQSHLGQTERWFTRQTCHVMAKRHLALALAQSHLGQTERWFTRQTCQSRASGAPHVVARAANADGAAQATAGDVSGAVLPTPMPPVLPTPMLPSYRWGCPSRRCRALPSNDAFQWRTSRRLSSKWLELCRLRGVFLPPSRGADGKHRHAEPSWSRRRCRWGPTCCDARRSRLCGSAGVDAATSLRKLRIAGRSSRRRSLSLLALRRWSKSRTSLSCHPDAACTMASSWHGNGRLVK